ncbi:Atu4866 domain-containing protein [Kineococcus arenarius]|uniref:Atu4866 domain-containing protein n=1 Tax=unclassified Kineococcus TaxID=2621656 RepID=UPI003D7CA515
MSAATTGGSAGEEHPYVGTWVTADGWIRHRLLPGGRYLEARGQREHAYTGSYRVREAHIDYVDDTGFSADGDFVSDAQGRVVLHHAGMLLRREQAPTGAVGS